LQEKVLQNTLCGCGVKAGMVNVWVTGKTVSSPSWAVSHHHHHHHHHPRISSRRKS